MFLPPVPVIVFDSHSFLRNNHRLDGKVNAFGPEESDSSLDLPMRPGASQTITSTRCSIAHLFYSVKSKTAIDQWDLRITGSHTPLVPTPTTERLLARLRSGVEDEIVAVLKNATRWGSESS
jgi:hypothetical protein